LLATHRPEWAGRLYCAARKYGVVLWVPGEASRLTVLPPTTRRLAMSSLSNLSKFLGFYNSWKNIIADTGLKWSNGSSEDMVIDRLTRVRDPDEVIAWVRSVKEMVPSLSTFMDFAAFTGLRFVEAVNGFNLIVKLDHTENLREYYDIKQEILGHYRFRDLFMRGSKKVFVSFVSKNLLDAVKGCPNTSKNAIQKRIRKAGIRLRFGDVREYWATTMTKTLQQPEIDFLQGRISTSVFMRHYFNPAWIKDLKDRTLKAADDILGEIGV